MNTVALLVVLSNKPDKRGVHKGNEFVGIMNIIVTIYFVIEQVSNEFVGIMNIIVTIYFVIEQVSNEGGCSPQKKPKKTKKNQKKPSQFTNFGVATGFFWFFLGFFGFFWFFLVFFGFFWDDIPTIKSNAKKNQKIPKNPKKNQKKPKTSFQFRMLAKA